MLSRDSDPVSSLMSFRFDRDDEALEFAGDALELAGDALEFAGAALELDSERLSNDEDLFETGGSGLVSDEERLF